ncbi:hypothetical protein HanIR_Chr01g0034821 [Helianthus annuus]|nr:hypothetical protein HanIR_Chr01g0034821 [Helianthus annuus]
MTTKLLIRGLPPAIRGTNRRQPSRVPKAPNQTINIQHQQVIQIGLLSLTMS